LKGENFQNASEIQGKYLRFSTQKSRKCAQNFFFNLQSEHLKNAPGLHGKQLRFWTQNRENAPKTFL